MAAKCTPTTTDVLRPKKKPVASKLIAQKKSGCKIYNILTLEFLSTTTIIYPYVHILKATGDMAVIGECPAIAIV